jgi:transposase-like protein
MKSVLSAHHFQNEEAAFAYVESKLWPTGPECPHCGVVGQAGRLQGKSTRPGLWKCYACRKPFTVRMRSVFEYSHVPMTIWLQAMYLMCSSKKGISTRQLQRMIGCGLKTAWFLGHRIREAMKETHQFFDEPLGGPWRVVEGDETYIGRKAESRAYEPPAPKQSVMSLVERGGAVRSFHIPNVTAANLQPIIAKHVHIDSRYMTDTSWVSASLGFPFRGRHQTVNHSAKEYVRGIVYTNTVEGYFSILKRGIYGVYQHVSEAHLQRYLTEFDFRYSNRAKLGIDDEKRTDLAIIGAQGRRLTYRTVGRFRPTPLTQTPP